MQPKKHTVQRSHIVLPKGLIGYCHPRESGEQAARFFDLSRRVIMVPAQKSDAKEMGWSGSRYFIL